MDQTEDNENDAEEENSSDKAKINLADTGSGLSNSPILESPLSDQNQLFREVTVTGGE